MSLFRTYQALAMVVGVLLVAGTLDAIAKYGFAEGSSVQRLGEDFDWIWMIHGWIYIVYVVVAFVLTQKALWPLSRFLLLMVAGLVPGLIFYVERQAARQLREENPELVGASPREE
ncbi:DUF3817 domain-containing protein [Nocardioides panacisoli]|uniref:DUF3817 domain-containing protein n=1 Tax=Nocardioides panacisoli TaxID=627624 RepID=UPI001C63A0F3|nr:DUF3817 domain-containing protein [Nocardioides panacisoli]QYJ03241.1 DUF3817 domain-containing protein [Nocardioides panacisoli]